MTLPVILAIVTAAIGHPQPAGAAPPSSPSASTTSACAVTTPNHHAPPPGSDPRAAGSQSWFGNDAVGTSLWPEGTIVFRPGGSGFVLPDGALSMKFLWLKAPGARLTLSGHRVDDPSIALRFDLDHQFDSKGFQPSALIFPTPGCWQVNATTDGETLTFVTSVVKIGAGPAAAR